MTQIVVEHLDCTGMKCPMPLVTISKVMKDLEPGQQLQVEADDLAFKADIQAWIERLGHKLIEFSDGPVMRVVVEKSKPASPDLPVDPAAGCDMNLSPALAQHLEERISQAVDRKFADLEKRVRENLAQLNQTGDSPGTRQVTDRATFVAFSGDMDKLMAAFIMATGAAAMGMEVTIFFTFWGLVALKKETKFKNKPLTQKLMAAMLPSGPANVGTSKMNWCGMGPKFFKKVMKDNQVETLPGLIEKAKELNVHLVACQMAMELMGITREELIDGVEFGGVGTYLGAATDSKLSLFI